MKTVRAIFENGVFRPTEPVELPDHSMVEFEPRFTDANAPAAESSGAPMSEGLARIYAILGERYASGETDTAARHNEHQP
jgi:predicted DNA-binding antitoxin AbrB/MazE fold protein